LTQWGDADSPYYEKAMMMRSIENAVYFASVNYALRFQESATCLIDPSGKCQAYLPYGEEGVLVQRVRIEDATRLYAARFAPQRFQECSCERQHPVASTASEVAMPAFVIERMRPTDWDDVRRIYLEGLATGQASFETEAPSWEQWNEARLPHSRLVARENGRVVAWAALSPASKRPCYAGVAETSIYVAADVRGRGAGKALLQKLIEESQRNGIWSLYGATFAENAASIQMQLACGFRIVGRRERIAQHQGVWRDTIITERRSRTVGANDAADSVRKT
jgi:phosphinothricin acetyltransferase